MRVFISRLHLIYSRRNSKFPAEIASCGSKLYYKGLYGHISDLEHFPPILDIHSKTEFSCLHPIIIEF